jgi:5-deoxy-glucuronate isomerase
VLPDQHHPASWKYTSTSEPGFHPIVSPANSACRSLWFFRLNLLSGRSFTLRQDDLELSAAVIDGSVALMTGEIAVRLGKRDSFYLPAGREGRVVALERAALYLGGAPYEGIGDFYVRRYDPALPIGPIHQVHGDPPMRREVFMTCDPGTPASRIMSGISWSDPGGWSSWPPHEHERHLDEAYFYFDMPEPQFGLHLSYLEPGKVDTVHVVHSGDCVITPSGYQANVSPPGFRNTYLWVSAAHSRESRRTEGVAVNDPSFA